MQKSFTLIELIVVVIIISTITAVSLISMQSARRNRDTRAVAENIKNQILKARSTAMSGSSTDILVEFSAQEMKIAGAKVLTLPDNIASIATPFTFVAVDPNKIGQIKSGADASVCLAGGADKFQITVNHLTGNTEIKSGGACP